MGEFAKIFTDVSQITGIIGLLALVVSVITEVLKQVAFLNKQPTGCVVIVVSMIVCIGAYFGLTSYLNMVIDWFGVFAAFIAAFVVAIVSMNGWDYLSELASRMIRK